MLETSHFIAELRQHWPVVAEMVWTTHCHQVLRRGKYIFSIKSDTFELTVIFSLKLFKWVYVETNPAQRPLTLCIRFVTDCSQIKKHLNGTDSLLVVYNPLTESRTTFRNLASLLSNEFKYNPITVAAVASSSEKEVDPLSYILPSCQHFRIDFEQPRSDRHLKVSDMGS